MDAVDTDGVSLEPWEGAGYKEDCETISFRLDGVVYTATQDPSDGYRSSMSGIAKSERPMRNVFAPVKVIGRLRTRGEYGGTDDVLELIDAKTGKTVLEVGTDDVDDYYPCWVARFDPTAMASNATDHAADQGH